jgi:hypothetical protein
MTPRVTVLSCTSLAFALALAALLLPTSASAQSSLRAQCAAEIKSQCAGVQPGEGRIRACIETHLASLSPQCQAGLAKVAAIVKSCAADAKQLCGDVKPGGGRIVSCMKEHLDAVSGPCKDALGKDVAGNK